MSAAATPRWQLTLEAVARFPRPGASIPAALAFSPDSRFLTFLFSERGDLTRDLWALDLDRGERRLLAQAPDGGVTDANVNAEEALRRERRRQREGGITQYSWAKRADRILVPINGQLYVTSSAGEPLRAVAAADEPAADARLTPDGRRVVFVRERELWVADIDGTEVGRLTHDATDTVSNGLAEFIAQEEMGRSEGFWVSPDGEWLAFTRVDEGNVPSYPIVHQGREWRLEQHRYPFAGEPNARVQLGMMPLGAAASPELNPSTSSGEPLPSPSAKAPPPVRWLDLAPYEEGYLARVDWSPEGQLFVQLESRDQRTLELRRYDPSTGSHWVLLVEEADPWINLHHDLRALEDGSFVWASEAIGFKHLALHGADGQPVRQLTDGKWPVDSVVHVDEEHRVVYFLAGRESPLSRRLYRVGLDGGEPAAFGGEGTFQLAVFSTDGSWYSKISESRLRPPSITVNALDRPRSRLSLWERPAMPAAAGEPGEGDRMVLHEAASHDEVAPGIQPPEIVELAAADGTPLYGAIYRPLGAPPFPTVVSVYGGPHAQMVRDAWELTVDLRAQYLASLGFLVFKLDNRGSARRGLAFEAHLHRRMGTVEVEDQAAGVRWLADQGLADPARVGIYGWSYGGYLALMCLLKAPEIFRAAVAGAPVVDWDGYDTHYTERYMGTPADNPAGYREASVLTHVEHLKGALLIVHGMVDENVHFRHTARLIESLQEANRPFELLAFPSERHIPRGEAGRRYLEERLANFFQRYLA